MSEKKGNTIKLEYDFNTAANLEIYNSKLKGWFRVTSREFRSFNGKRRIQGEEFKGKLYLFGTNKEVKSTKYKLDTLVGYQYIPSKRAY